VKSSSGNNKKEGKVKRLILLHFTPADKKNFYIIARGSVFETSSLYRNLLDEGVIS